MIHLLLPLYDNEGRQLARDIFGSTREELVTRFGGLTAYTRSPATGLWIEEDGKAVRDDLVIYEVMSDTLDENWWRDYRKSLEKRFRQELIVIRVQEIRLL